MASTLLVPPTADRAAHRVLDAGPVTATYSAWARYPKYHLDGDCDGLDSVREANRATRRFRSGLALAKVEGGRPCRRCALEPVLAHAWERPSLHWGPQVPVTVSGQGNPHEPQHWSTSYDWGEVTASGAARLVRLAVRCGLTVTETGVGPVAHGVLPARYAAVLAANLRLYELPDAAVHPGQLAVFWTLATRDAAGGAGCLGAAEAWTLARATVV